MEFKRSPIVRWPVTVTQPDPDKPGAVRTDAFTGHFRITDIDVVQANAEQLIAAPDNRTRLQLERAFYAEHFVGWDGDLTDDGAPIPVSNETRDALLLSSWVLPGIRTAFSEILAGKARLGN